MNKIYLFNFNKGFTLLEFILTLFIVSMAALLVTTIFGNVTSKASEKIALEEMINIKNTISNSFFPDLGVSQINFPYGYNMASDHPSSQRVYCRRSWSRKGLSHQNSMRVGIMRKPDQ